MSPPPARGRPVIVIVAGILLIQVTLPATAFLLAEITVRETRRAAVEQMIAEMWGSRTDMHDAVAVPGAVLVAYGGTYLLVALVLALLGLLALRGSNAARIATWVVGGLGVVSGVLFALVAVPEMRRFYAGAGPAEFAFGPGAVAVEAPWHPPLILATTGFGTVTLLAALILLALPPANRFFRRSRRQRPGQAPSPQPAPPPVPDPPAGHPMAG